MILGIYGFQDAGKTSLVERLVRELVKNGYRVSSIKHTPHRKSIDCEGKDTWRHWQAGSDPVVFSSEIETSMIKHSKMSVDEIAGIIQTVFAPDIIIVEGFKGGSFPKVSVGNVKPRAGTVLVNPSMPKLVKYIEGEISTERVMKRLPGLDCGKCGMDCDALARAIASGKKRLEDCRELPERIVDIRVGSKRLTVGRFASAVVEDTIRGMLSSLKGHVPGKDVEIRLEGKNRASRRRT